MIEGKLRKFEDVVLQLVQEEEGIENDIWEEFWAAAVECGIDIKISTMSLGHCVDLRIKKQKEK